jgi:hypothetical protein
MSRNPGAGQTGLSSPLNTTATADCLHQSADELAPPAVMSCAGSSKDDTARPSRLASWHTRHRRPGTQDCGFRWGPPGRKASPSLVTRSAEDLLRQT